MYALYVCLTCMPYMYALYVCLICMPYMHALYACQYTCMHTCYIYVCVHSLSRLPTHSLSLSLSHSLSLARSLSLSLSLIRSLSLSLSLPLPPFLPLSAGLCLLHWPEMRSRTLLIPPSFLKRTGVFFISVYLSIICHISIYVSYQCVHICLFCIYLSISIYEYVCSRACTHTHIHGAGGAPRQAQVLGV
jgi:hypothetical protein